ncbi:MAG: tetratricopeptide repeat protein [Rhodobacteraceae bacterium]|nr:tetratricopeptide repeat protein [Paracoccaceae bacterium]
MLGFGKKSDDGVIKQGSEATFVEDVLEASKERPVITYFSAAWCGPCKTFGPELERSVSAAAGKVALVKFDTEANPQLAAQLRVQSIPAVFAFVDGRPVDMFVGAKSGSELAAFVRELAGNSANGGVDAAIEQAEALLAEGAAVEAAQYFSAVLSEDQENASGFSGLARAHLALGNVDKADGLLKSVPESICDHKDIQAARAAVDLAMQASEAGPVKTLEEQVQANPSDLQARFDLSTAKLAANDVEGSIDELLELFRRDREWQDGAARQQLFKIFESLKPGDPAALRGRRKLSSIIYP